MEKIKVKATVKAPAADKLITIPVSEYVYLQRLDSLMDVLLTDTSYQCTNTVEAVKMAVLAMRNGDVVGAGV